MFLRGPYVSLMWESRAYDEKSTYLIIFKPFLLFSTMWTHAQACIPWLKYTTVDTENSYKYISVGHSKELFKMNNHKTFVWSGQQLFLKYYSMEPVVAKWSTIQDRSRYIWQAVLPESSQIHYKSSNLAALSDKPSLSLNYIRKWLQQPQNVSAAGKQRI